MRIPLLACGLAAGLFLHASAHAEDLGNGLALNGEIALVSDYRFRGISLSDRDVAVQPTLTLAHESGFYTSVWGSNITDTGPTGNVEIDFTGGWSKEVRKGGTVNLGVAYYAYPDGNERLGPAEFGEVFGRCSQALGPVTGTLGVAYAWDQRALGNRDSLYGSVDLQYALPGVPVSLLGHVGRTDGALAPNGHYDDWSLGATVTRAPFAASLSYVDTDISSLGAAKGALISSVKLFF